jgi:hypothetical protein
VSIEAQLLCWVLRSLGYCESTSEILWWKDRKAVTVRDTECRLRLADRGRLA